MNAPSYPTFIEKKNGVYGGIPIFLVFAPKHIFWVGGSNEYPQAMF